MYFKFLLFINIQHIRLFSDNVHAVRRACAESIADVIDVIQLNEFQNELLPLLISLYSSCGNYQIQSNLLYTFQNILLSPLLPPNSDCATEIQTLLLKELSVFIVIVFGIESNSKYSIYHLQGHRKNISALYSEFPKGICSRHN